MLVGHPVLRHLGIDSRTLLERNRTALDGTDCSSVEHPSVSSCGTLGRLMIARLQRVTGKQLLTAKNRILYLRRPRGDYFAHKFDPDPFPNPSLIELDDSSEDDSINEQVSAMLDRAKENGFPETYWQQLQGMVSNHIREFRTKFSSIPAKVDPLRIEMTPDARPLRVKLRNYSSDHRAFMAALVYDLIRNNIIYPNPSSNWASAPLIIPKSGPSRWRFIVDLPPVNRFTVKHQFPMPKVEHELTKLSGSRYYANFDFSHGYWQLPLHPDSQECQSFITSDGVFSPTRVLHGTTNAVTHLQSFLTLTLPDELKPKVLLWVDDCLLHAKTIPELLTAIDSFLKFCEKYNWKLHPDKCVLFTTSVKWCGRIITADGIRHDPKTLEGFVEMDCPRTGGQLQQFLCAMQWLRSSIPQFQSIIQPLHDFLETIFRHVGKRTKRAVSRVVLADAGWTSQHTVAFESCKQAIIHRTTLAYRDESKRLCIYTDASDSYWSGILTQVSPSQLSLSHHDQDHEPLAFHSGRFSPTQLSWSTLEKEAFAVLASVERSHWLAACPGGFDLFTDHNNLVFLFDPLAIMPDLGQAALRKVLRWAVRISAYNYVCFHIRGEANVWADLLTRWSIPLTIRRLVTVSPLPTTFREFTWPSIASIQLSQTNHASSRPRGLVLSNQVWRKSTSGPIWVPDADADLQLRLAVIAHTSAAGHRGGRATEDAISSQFFLYNSARGHFSFRSIIHSLHFYNGGRNCPSSLRAIIIRNEAKRPRAV